MRFLSGFSAMLLGAALSATPALAAEPCKTDGSETAVVLRKLPPEAGPDFWRALAAATQPETVAAALAASESQCTRLPSLRGENTDAFPRTWRMDRYAGAAITYLVPLSIRREGRPVTLYALVTNWGSGAIRVSALLDGLPLDASLSKMMRLTAGGGFEPLGFDEKTGTLIDKNNYLAFQIERSASRFSYWQNHPD